jgi:hypothetical protein
LDVVRVLGFKGRDLNRENPVGSGTDGRKLFNREEGNQVKNMGSKK